jgi:hypothetical protein
LNYAKLKLSHEHQGFVFEPSIAKAADLLTKHSGGKISTALRKALELGSIECSVPGVTIPDTNVVPNEEDEFGEVRIQQKEVIPSNKEKSIFDCFDCWRTK